MITSMRRLLRWDPPSNSISFDETSARSNRSFSTLFGILSIFPIYFFRLPISSSSWSWMNSRLFAKSPMSTKILSKCSLVAWSLDWINSVMFFSWFWSSSFTTFLMMSEMHSFSLLTSLITFLIVSRRDISFVCDADGVH